MATKKKEENPVAEIQNDPLQEENQSKEGNTLVAASTGETAPEQAPEIPQTSEEAGNTRVGAESSKPSDGETRTSDNTGNEPVEKPSGPKLESLSVLADRHRIPAWQQAALSRYMGWQDDKMVSDDEYRKALTGLRQRRIGGGRK